VCLKQYVVESVVSRIHLEKSVFGVSTFLKTNKQERFAYVNVLLMRDMRVDLGLTVLFDFSS